MPPNQPSLLLTEPLACRPGVLEAVMQFTQASNSEDVRGQFAEALAQIFPITGMRFFGPGLKGGLNELSRCRIDNPRVTPRLRWEREPRRNITPFGSLARCLRERHLLVDERDSGRLYFPVFGAHSLIEVLEIEHQPCSPAEANLLRQVLHIYGNFLTLLHSQEIDTLTGLHDRGAFDAFLSLTAQSLAARTRQNDPDRWWLLMIDVDHVKSVNDRFGHLIGDEVLLLLARTMRSCFRGVDRLYRYGGEEFAVLLSPCRRASALAAAERFRSTVEQLVFPQVKHLTVSIGMAPLERYDHPSNIIGRADSALYQAKREGRNRICEASGLAEAEAGTSTLELFS